MRPLPWQVLAAARRQTRYSWRGSVQSLACRAARPRMFVSHVTDGGVVHDIAVTAQLQLWCPD